MQTHTSSFTNGLRGENSHASGQSLEAVQIGNGLIAFYPQEMHQPQPYVILLNPASGILKRLNLKAAK
jgi:hypothetical protein